MHSTCFVCAKWVIADVPTHALAQEAKMSFDEYSDFLFKSCYLDLDDPVAKLRELDEKQTKWANNLVNHGMIVEHNLARLYVWELENAL